MGDPVPGQRRRQFLARQGPFLTGQHQGRAGGQGHQQLPDRGVETGGRQLQDPAGDVHAEPFGLRRHEGGQARVRDGHSFGTAGGAGRVDHVGRVRRLWRSDPLGVREGLAGQLRQPPRGPRVVQRHPRPGPGRQGGRRPGAGHQRLRCGVRQHERQPLRGVTGVQRQVRGARLQHAESRHDQLRRPWERHRNHILGAHPEPGEVARDAVGPRVQFRVREAFAAPHQGRGFGAAGRPRLEQVRERRAGLGGRRRGAVAGQQLLALGAGDHLQPVHTQARFGHHLFEEQPQTGYQLLGRGAVEQVGVVLQGSVQAAGAAVLALPLAEREEEVDAGGAGVRPLQVGLEPGESECGAPGVLEHERHLEQWVAGRRPGRCQRLDQVLERHVLMGVGGQRRTAHPAEEFGEGRVAAQIGPQHEGVDEEADHPVERLVEASGHGEADRDVLACSEP